MGGSHLKEVAATAGLTVHVFGINNRINSCKHPIPQNGIFYRTDELIWSQRLFPNELNTITRTHISRINLIVACFCIMMYLIFTLVFSWNKSALGPWIAHLNPCHGERILYTKYIYHFSSWVSFRSKPKPINSLSSIKIITYPQNFNVWTFSQPEMSGVCIRSNILLA